LVVVICSDWRSKINQADINLLTDISYKLFRQKLRGNVSYKCVCRLFYHTAIKWFLNAYYRRYVLTAINTFKCPM